MTTNDKAVGDEAAHGMQAGAGAGAGAGGGGYRAVFAVGEFRAVFAAHVASLLGTVIAELSLTVLVFRLTGSPLLTALTFALGFLPYVIGGTLFAGLADRFPARPVLIADDLLCAACTGIMIAPAIPVAVLLTLRCVMAAAAPVFTGARAANLAEILGGDAFTLGRSLLRMVTQGAQIGGFALGGLLLVAVQPRAALAITLAAFLMSAAVLRCGTRLRPARGGRSRKPSGGTRVLLRDRRVRALLLLWWAPSAFTVWPEALAAPYAHGIGADSRAVGLLLAAMPVATIVSELVVGTRCRPATRTRLVLPLVACTLLPLLGFVLHPGLWGAIALLIAVGACQASTLGLDQWFNAAVVEELRGRAMTLLSAGLMTVQGLGMAVAGAAAEFVPPHVVVVAAGVVGCICVLAVVREVRSAGADGDRPRHDGRSPAQPSRNL